MFSQNTSVFPKYGYCILYFLIFLLEKIHFILLLRWIYAFLLLSRIGETSLSSHAAVNFSSTNIFHTFHILFTLIISFTNWWLHYLISVCFVLYFTIKKFNHSAFTNHLNWSEPVCTCLSFSLKGIYLEIFLRFSLNPNCLVKICPFYVIQSVDWLYHICLYIQEETKE